MEATRGEARPLGATRKENGFNFALFSKHAQRVQFFLFDPERGSPIFEITLDPKIHKTGDVWHLFVKEVPEYSEYGFMIDGPATEDKNLLYNPSVILTDPYAKTLNFPHEWGAERPRQLHGGVVDHLPFDWQEDKPLNLPMKELIIYEMHVRGFTQDPSSGVQNRGSYLGVVEKIPHLKALGVTAVELLPVFEFNECEYQLNHPETQEKLYNYWGYSTINFFSPMKRYASSAEWYAEIHEFKTMVRELHKNGIELILDVVYNHTAEGGKGGPDYSFRAIENPVYYMLDNKGGYKNYSGCGNTFNCNHPTASQVILESLRYWATEMHVDGFRFDLASILTREQNGAPSSNPFVIAAISEDPLLAHVKLIAEAWDAGGLYQVGHFPYGTRWADWNGKYRDTVRDFIKGTDGMAEPFVHALTGSEYLYGKFGSPYQSINFITAHDGFSLHDLVTYQEKHNEANGERNRDGTNDNRSWNCGCEGETANPQILALRERQKRNLHLALMLSLGVPMILMGDEYSRTAYGNNNTWCQDNELNWFLWNQLADNPRFFRFYAKAIALRKEISLLFPEGFFKDEQIDWHSAQTPFHPHWAEDSRFVAYTLKNAQGDPSYYIAFNAYHHEVDLQLPPLEAIEKDKKWYRIIDTFREAPEDFIEEPRKTPPLTKIYKMPPHSAVVFISI